jgi:hypothetical protein
MESSRRAVLDRGLESDFVPAHGEKRLVKFQAEHADKWEG